MSPGIKNQPVRTSTGDNSFEAVFARNYSLVYQLAYRCVGRSDEAEDIAQEVFLCYYRTPPHATHEAEQRAWLCRVATNLSLNAMRADQRRHSREEQVGDIMRRSAPDEQARQNPEQHALAGEQTALVRAVLAELPEQQQAYLLLRSIGLSYMEIAQATGVATASVGALLARAERLFRRKFHERVSAHE
jgi:RNA polymerase sigma factor (sigma-70 family)